MEQRTTSSPKRCASSKCKQKKWWRTKNNKSTNLRACHLCHLVLCRVCQVVVIIDPHLSYWQAVAENYNPHGDYRPIGYYHFLPGELYDVDDYIAFCLKCSKTPTSLALVRDDRERKDSLNFVPDATQ